MGLRYVRDLFMAAHSNGRVIIFRSSGYFLLLLSFFLSFFLIFPRLFSAVGNWMSTILPHMMWP